MWKPTPLSIIQILMATTVKKNNKYPYFKERLNISCNKDLRYNLIQLSHVRISEPSDQNETIVPSDISEPIWCHSTIAR